MSPVLELLWICSSSDFWACGFDSLGKRLGRGARVWSHLAPGNDDGASELLERPCSSYFGYAPPQIFGHVASILSKNIDVLMSWPRRPSLESPRARLR